MAIKPKFLKKLIFLLVILGFVLPIQAPVSAAKAKLCCVNKGHCVMGNALGAKISAMGQSESVKMIACCQDNCVFCSDTSVLLYPTAKISSQNMGISTTPAFYPSVVVRDSFFDNGPPNQGGSNFRSITGFPSSPIFQLNSIFLI